MNKNKHLLHHFGGILAWKKWSQFLDSGTRSPIFGRLKMGTFAKNYIFGLLSYIYNIYQGRIEIWKLFDILVHPTIHPLWHHATFSYLGRKQMDVSWILLFDGKSTNLIQRLLWTRSLHFIATSKGTKLTKIYISILSIFVTNHIKN